MRTGYTNTRATEGSIFPELVSDIWDERFNNNAQYMCKMLLTLLLYYHTSYHCTSNPESSKPSGKACYSNYHTYLLNIYLFLIEGVSSLLIFISVPNFSSKSVEYWLYDG
jgi:hypothetical protein